jgi:hypothetical protein
MDDVRTPAVGVHGDGHRIALKYLHPVGLDQRIDRKRPTRLLLAIAAVTAMDKHRRGSEPVTDEAAEAGAVVKCAQNRPPILPMRMIERIKNKIKLARKKEDVYLPSTKEAAMSALNIKDKAVAEKARRLAKLKGTTITEAVAEALEASLRTAEHRSKLDRDRREREVDEILKRIRAVMPPDDPDWKMVDDMYDEYGLPK